MVVKAGARHQRIEKKGEVFHVSVNASPEAGKANEAVLRMLGEHLGVAPSRLRIVFGHKLKRKLIEIQDGQGVKL